MQCTLSLRHSSSRDGTRFLPLAQQTRFIAAVSFVEEEVVLRTRLVERRLQQRTGAQHPREVEQTLR